MKNCQRSTTPRIDIQSKADAKKARSTSTDAQRADQALAEERRAAAYARTPRRVGLDRQVAHQRTTTHNLRTGTYGSAAQLRHARLAPPA